MGRSQTLPVVLILVAGLACQAPERGTRSLPAMGNPIPAAASRSASARNLERDEQMGGHTLGKHVGRSDDQLRERLTRQRNISAASTWTDRRTAEQAVGVVLEQNGDKIERWLAEPEGHPNLVLDYDGDPAHPIGRSFRRGANQAEPCSHALVVLKWAGESEYYVLTSYPECRQ